MPDAVVPSTEWAVARKVVSLDLGCLDLAKASVPRQSQTKVNAIDKFFSNLAAVNWGPLLLALLCYGTYMTIRSRASFHVLRAAYPTWSIIER